MVKFGKESFGAMTYGAVSKKTERTGTCSAMASALIYGFNPLLAKAAYAGGCTDIALVMYYTLVAVFVLGTLMRIFKMPLLPKREHIKPLLITGIFGAVTTLLLFSSYNYIATGIATTLHFTYPVFVAVGGIFVLKQRLTKGKMAALGLSLLGICLAADLGGSMSITGVLLALTSGMTYAAHILLMDKTGLKDFDFISICLHMSVIKVFIAGIYGGIAGKLTLRMSSTPWLMIILLGLGAGIGATILFQVGVRYIGATNAAIFSMFEPVTSLLVGVFFMNEAMTVLKTTGCILILLGIVITVTADKQ